MHRIGESTDDGGSDFVLFQRTLDGSACGTDKMYWHSGTATIDLYPKNRYWMAQRRSRASRQYRYRELAIGSDSKERSCVPPEHRSNAVPSVQERLGRSCAIPGAIVAPRGRSCVALLDPILKDSYDVHIERAMTLSRVISM